MPDAGPTALEPRTEPRVVDDPQSPVAPAVHKTPSRLLERVGDFAVVRLPLRGFKRLTKKQRILAYHLTQASLSGRDVTIDQRHKAGLALRARLDGILTHNASLPRDLLDRIRGFAKQVWISGGPYHARTYRKLKPTFTPAEWEVALTQAAGAGARWPEVDKAELASLLFDPNSFPMLSVRSPQAGQDPLLASGNNLYSQVAMSDLAGFEERYALNSRLVKVGESLVEEVYRCGRAAAPGERPAPSGRYAAELGAVAKHLKRAVAWAEAAQQTRLLHMIEYLETGDQKRFDDADIAWLADAPTVDFVLGFIETDTDPRGLKAEWEGIVSIVDPVATTLITGLAARAQAFEDQMPWPDEYKRTGLKPAAPRAVQVLAAHGGSAPGLPFMLDLPNSPTIAKAHGSRQLLLANVIRGADEVTSELAIAEFAPPTERKTATQQAALVREVEMVLHEIIGHRTGRMSEALLGKDPATYLKEWAYALEEARADLVALHLAFDPAVKAAVPGWSDAHAEAMLRAFVRRDLTNLRRVSGPRIVDDHARAVHLVAQFAASRGAVEVVDIGGKRYQVVKDVAAMRAANKELLGRLQTLRAEGDYTGARSLFETHAVAVDASLQSEVAIRAKRAGMPRFYAFVMPELKAVRSPEGAVIDVKLAASVDLETQMLGWAQTTP